MTNPLNPDDMPEVLLTRIAEFASTILLDIQESDKYEDILDDIAADYIESDITTDPQSYYNSEAQITRQLYRTLALLLLDKHGMERHI